MRQEVEHLYSNFFAIMLLSLLIWGESRGEVVLGKTAVGWVVRNRVYATRQYGKGWNGVMLRKKQFSCFNEGDVNREKIEEIVFNPKAWKEFEVCFGVALEVYFGFGFDPTIGATHYFVKGLAPVWARKMTKTAVMGNHVFYKYPNE